MVAQVGSEIQSLDLQVFQQQMSLVYYQIDALDNQFGNQDEIAFVSQGQPQKLTRSQIQGRFKYVPNGRLDNSNPQLRVATALRIGQMFANPQAPDPDIKQRDLKKIILNSIDMRISKKVFKSDKEVAQEQQQQQQAIQQQKMQAMKDHLQLQQALKGINVQGDIQKNKADAQIEVLKEAGFTPNDIKEYFAEAQIDVWKQAQLEPIQGKKYAPG